MEKKMWKQLTAAAAVLSSSAQHVPGQRLRKRTTEWCAAT